MTTVQSFSDCTELVAASRNKKSKPIANNTWVEARDLTHYAVRLHATDVVTYLANGNIVLDTGGWLTVTTKERISRFSPFGISSHKGQWRVAYKLTERHFAATEWSPAHSIVVPDYENSVPYADGITFARQDDGSYEPVEGTFPDTRVEEEQARARKEIDRDLKKYKPAIKVAVAKWQAELREHNGVRTGGDCFYCQGIVTDLHSGNVSDTNDHLWQHLREGYVPFALVANAYEHKLARGRDDAVQFLLRHITIGYLRDIEGFTVKFLRDRLYPAGIATSQGRRATTVDTTKVANFVDYAKDALQKPSDFGYFGDDEALFNTSAPTYGRNRDSESLENANFEIVWEALVAEFPSLVNVGEDRNVENPGGIYVFHAGHWAVGWVEQIVVPVVLDADKPVAADNLHPAFIRVSEFAEAVRRYPALPGAKERAAVQDSEDEARSITSDLKYIGAPEGITVADVHAALSEEGVSYDWYHVQVAEVLARAAEERAYEENAARNTVAGQKELF
jgi:hypothetical protein